MDERVCTNCIFCRQSDYGYSNYTVEGTTASCLFGLIPEFDTDDCCGSDPEKRKEAKKICEKCPHFTQGTGLAIDCDQEDLDANIAAWRGQYIKDKHGN